MAGFPQLREWGLLYAHGTTERLAMVRLFEHMDGSGRWEVRFNSPASSPTRKHEHPDEQSARVEMAGVYASGEPHGTWQIHQVERY